MRNNCTSKYIVNLFLRQIFLYIRTHTHTHTHTRARACARARMHLHCMLLQYDAFIFRYHDVATLNFYGTLYHFISRKNTTQCHVKLVFISISRMMGNSLLYALIYFDFHRLK